MGKAKKVDNQAWLAWLSDESPQGAHQQQKPAPSWRATNVDEQYTDDDFSSPKLSSTSTIHLKSQSSTQHISPQYAAPRPSMKPKPIIRPVSSPNNRAIDINISIPKITLPKLPHFSFPWRRVLWIGGGLVLIVAIIFGTPRILQLKTKQAQKDAAATTVAKPAYSPLKPSTGTVSGAQYDSKKQLYKYDDTFMGATLTISQQPLPDVLRLGKTKLAEVAKNSIGAIEKFETVNGDVYINTDTKTGFQRMVVAHRQLLIFIFSTKTLNNADWVTYIQTLQ